MVIDLNADVGEGFDDAGLMPYLTSANVACGGHAGDDQTIAATIALANRHGVQIGAHPSYADRENFGRSLKEITEAELVAQLRRVPGARHVKAHGALYHRAATDRATADLLTTAILTVNAQLVVVAQPGALLLDVARERGLATATEGFADRAYDGDRLRPRGEAGALITDPATAAEQALRLAAKVQTLCVHSDTEGAAAIAAAVRRALEAAGYTLRAPC